MPKYTHVIVFQAQDDEDAKSQVEDAIDTTAFEGIYEDTLTDESGKQV